LLNDVSRGNKEYLSKLQFGNFEDFVKQASFFENDKVLLLDIYKKGQDLVQAFDLLLEKAQDTEQLRAVCEKDLKAKLAESEANRLINGVETLPLSPDEKFRMKLFGHSKLFVTPENSQKFAAKTYLTVLLSHLKERVKEVSRKIE
jgi:hypothetical protein